MSDQLSLFETLDQQAKEAEAKAQQEHRAFMSELAKCLFCGETMQRSVMNFNHGIVFNGWCMKALAIHTRNKGQTWTKDAAWLIKKGIDVEKSRFDQSQWHVDNQANHYELHYGRCYWEGCDK